MEEVVRTTTLIAIEDGTDDAPDSTALAEGDNIVAGRYQITQLLYRRPRLNLYLGRRISPHGTSGEDSVPHREYEPLVAIRELVLTGLPSLVQDQIEVAAFEEFVSPIVLGSPRLPAGGDRVWVEGERHYLIMQLQDHREECEVATLETILLNHAQWPMWLNHKIALHWGTQLCRIVARLHRLGVVLADLDPATILVDRQGTAPWSPILLTSWPPAPQFWPVAAEQSANELYASIFPIAIGAECHPFIAPEVLMGVCDERSDVYSLGAILYLLLTGYAPVAAARRLAVGSSVPHPSSGDVASEPPDEARLLPVSEGGALLCDDGFELIPPHLLCDHVPSVQEKVLLTALNLDPDQRYASAFELVEALEEAEAATVKQR